MKRLSAIITALVLFCHSFCASAVSVSAKSAVLISGDTFEVVFEKNAHTRLSMASTTKIMTGLLICENKNLDDKVTVTADMLRVEGSSMGLRAGDVLTYRDLLYGLMLLSGNDAANVAAISIGKSLENFADMMNKKAKKLGLRNTNFVTPSGLDSENHYTTAYDLACLTRYALLNEDFAHVVSTYSVNITYGNPPVKRTLTNHNKLLKRVDGVVGVKTGFTKKSGRCLVSAYKSNGRFLIAVTLNAPNDWQDHEKLIDYGVANTKVMDFHFNDSYSLLLQNSNMNSVEFKVPSITLCCVSADNITATVSFANEISAPVNKGEVLGVALYKCGEKEIYTEKIIMQFDIEKVVNKKIPSRTFIKCLCCVFFGIWEN